MSRFILNFFSARPCASVREEWVSVRVSRGVAPARCRALLQTCANMATRKKYSWVQARRDERWTGLARGATHVIRGHESFDRSGEERGIYPNITKISCVVRSVSER